MKDNWMSSKYLVVFFALTLAWTWICGFIPIVFGLTGTGLGTFEMPISRGEYIEINNVRNG